MHHHPATATGHGRLDIVHVHQLIRLLDEAHELPTDGPEREHHLVSGVARIVGAAVAGAVLEGESTRTAPAQVGNTFLPLIRAVMRVTPFEPGAAITMTWNELVADRRYDREHVAQHPRPASLRDAVFSSVRLRMPLGVHGLALYRGLEDRAFREDERNLIHVFHTACGSLLQAPTHDGADGSVREGLSPRQRQTLDLVLRGLSDKEIADDLGISRFTVNQYTKAIYRHYSVSSRSQLLARLLAQPRAAPSLIIGS